jgi:hypothetical protein
MATFTFHAITQALIITSLLQSCIADTVAPLSIKILETHVTNCDIPIFTSISTNNTSLKIAYDTSKSEGTTSDVLAWSDSTSSTETVCNVCTTFQWTSDLYGIITSIDYDYYHRLDSGMLEQVASIITTNNGTSEVCLQSSSFLMVCMLITHPGVLRLCIYLWLRRNCSHSTRAFYPSKQQRGTTA